MNECNHKCKCRNQNKIDEQKKSINKSICFHVPPFNSPPTQDLMDEQINCIQDFVVTIACQQYKVVLFIFIFLHGAYHFFHMVKISSLKLKSKTKTVQGRCSRWDLTYKKSNEKQVIPAVIITVVRVKTHCRAGIMFHIYQ